MKTIIFACIRNAGRSQMAAACFNKLADPAKARALSAGTTPGDRVHPEVVAVMQEEGIDLSGARPRRGVDRSRGRAVSLQLSIKTVVKESFECRPNSWRDLGEESNI